MLQFMCGALTMACFTAGMFFLRFYRDSGDRLFAMFSGAFTLLALHWAILGCMSVGDEHRPLTYMIRLLAFGLILLGVVDKNRRAR
jgi:hypothetical protein